MSSPRLGRPPPRARRPAGSRVSRTRWMLPPDSDDKVLLGRRHVQADALVQHRVRRTDGRPVDAEPRRGTARPSSTMCSSTVSPAPPSRRRVLRHATAPPSIAVRAVRPCKSPTRTDAVGDRPQAERHLAQLLLPLPATPATPTSSPGCTSRSTPLSATCPGHRAPWPPAAPGLQARAPARRSLHGRAVAPRRPTMASTSAASVNVAGAAPRSGSRCRPQHGDLVGDRADLAQLVRHQHHRRGLVAQLGDDRRTAPRPPAAPGRWSARRG